MVTPHLVARQTGIISLMMPNRPSIRTYAVGASVTLDAAFAGATAMFSVSRGASYRSSTLRKNKLGWTEESTLNQTRVSYDPNDFASATVPGDKAITFVRITETDMGGTALDAGPILVVPPSMFFATGRRNLVVNGTAPDIAAGLNNLPPTGVMIFKLPRFADEFTIHNDGDGVNIFLSFGEGLQEVQITAGESMSFTEAGVNLLYIRGDTGTAAFRAVFSLVNGLQS